MERSGWVVGVIVIVLIFGISLFFFSQYSYDYSFDEVAEVSLVELEATVLSVISDDEALIRIESLSSETELPEEDCIVGSEIYDEPIVYPAPEVGVETGAEFSYGTNHLIERIIPVESQTLDGDEEEVVYRIPKPQKEGDQWVIERESSEADEIQEEEFLPGLSEGDVFRAIVPVTNLCTYTIGEYSIVSK